MLVKIHEIIMLLNYTHFMGLDKPYIEQYTRTFYRLPNTVKYSHVHYNYIKHGPLVNMLFFEIIFIHII